MAKTATIYLCLISSQELLCYTKSLIEAHRVVLGLVADISKHDPRVFPAKMKLYQ